MKLCPVGEDISWALARASDLHLNTYKVLTSSNNSTQHTVKVPRRTHLSDGFSARALKHRYMACYGTRLSPDSRAIKDTAYRKLSSDRYSFELSSFAQMI